MFRLTPVNWRQPGGFAYPALWTFAVGENEKTGMFLRCQDPSSGKMGKMGTFFPISRSIKHLRINALRCHFKGIPLSPTAGAAQSLKPQTPVPRVRALVSTFLAIR